MIKLLFCFVFFISPNYFHHTKCFLPSDDYCRFARAMRCFRKRSMFWRRCVRCAVLALLCVGLKQNINKIDSCHACWDYRNFHVVQYIDTLDVLRLIKFLLSFVTQSCKLVTLFTTFGVVLYLFRHIWKMYIFVTQRWKYADLQA